MNPCPLCAERDAPVLFATPGHVRTLLRCAACDLLFVAASDRPDARAEKAHYLTHQNDPDDPGYRAFLDRLLVPLGAELQAGARGLDYGCGPGPTAARMLGERGLPTANYDPFFAPDTGQLDQRYDFLVCTESVEHFHQPHRDFARIDRLVRPGGWIGIMTETVDERLSPSWWYLRDPTHVSFYSARTMQWIARTFAWSVTRPAKNVVLFHKRAR